MNAPFADHRALVALVQTGDKAARSELVEQLTPLVNALAKRLAGPSEREDFFQAGVIGLLKAAQRYNCRRQTRFTTYAVPWIEGEMRAYRRLHRPGLTVSRSAWEKWRALEKARRELTQLRQEEPALSVLAAAIKTSPEEVSLILEASRPVVPLEEADLAGEGWHEPALLDRLCLDQSLRSLSPLERRLILLRFYEEQTQAEIARRLELSQRQVSRLEKRILHRLRQLLTP